MKIKPVPALISLGIALLIAYGFYAANAREWQKWLMFAVAAIEFSVLLVGGFGIRYAERGGSNIAVLSAIFAAVSLIAHIIMTVAPFHAAPYIITSGTIVLLYAGIAHALAKSLF